MKILHLIAAGNNGGIQTLLKDYAKYSHEDNVFSFMWYSGITEEQMRQRGTETICFEAKKSGTFRAAIKLLNYVNEKKPDAVVVHSSPMLRLLGIIIKLFHKEIQLYLYCHAAIKDQLEQYGTVKRTVYDFINRICIGKSEKVIAISNYVKGTVQRTYNTPDEKIAVVYNSVDTERFDKLIHTAEKKAKIVFIGRLVKVKGIQFAIEALSKIPENLQWEFNIVGDGAYRDALEKLVKEKKLEDKITFWGSRNDVPDILSQMDIFLHPCTWEEGFGIGIVEAMASGKLCICSNSGAIPEIITNGTDGYLVEKCNADALADMLVKVMKQRDVWQEIQENAKRTAQKYSAVKFAHELDDLLEQSSGGRKK